MALLDDTGSPKPKPPRSSRKPPSIKPSSAPDSATLSAIQSLQSQIAALEAKEAAAGELTKAQAAKLNALETELAALKAQKPEAAPSPEPTPSEGARLAPWCPW